MKFRTDSDIIHDMADQMLRYGEGCTRDQLLMHFAGDEIDRLGEKARVLANERAIRARAA